MAISEKGNEVSLAGRKVGAPSKKTPKYAHQIIAAIIQHPNYSVDRLHRYIRNKYKCTNISRHLVQVLLEKHNLTQEQGRKRFAKENLFKDSTNNVRASILNTSNNIKITQKCKSLKVSRSTYYKWRAIYNKEQRLENNKAGVRSTVDPRIKKAIIDLIIMYPQWGVDKLYSFINENSQGQQLVSRRYIQYLLEKENLSTYNKRTVFSSLHTAHIPEAPGLAPVESQIITAETNRMVLARGDPPPPVGNYNKLYSVFTTIKNNSVASISTGIISLANAFLISKILIAIYQAETISQKIGMTLSSLALFCGLFFFLYSVKYYLTIAAVIFKTNSTNNVKKESKFSLFNKLTKKIPFFSNHNDPVSLHKKVQETELSEYPFFSVQIPLYNEKKVANRVTAAAAAMDYPNFEVLVCDDSTDETTQLLYDKWEGSDKVKILHRVNRAGFKGAALANALTQMDPRTEYVVVFDADFVPYPDTLQLFAKYFKVIGQNEGLNISASELYNTIKGEQSSANNLSMSDQYVGKTVAVQGYQWHVLNKSENWITRAVRSEFAGSYIIERSGGQVFGLLKQIAGSVYAINAKVLREVGWGTSITEDFQLTLKLYEQGYKVAYTPYIQAPSECVSTLKRLIRQRQRWAEDMKVKENVFQDIYHGLSHSLVP